MSALPGEIRQRIEVVLDRVRPALLADGGNIELLDVVEDGTVRVALQGACAECPAQLLTLRHGVEARLREAVPEVTSVVGCARPTLQALPAS